MPKYRLLTPEELQELEQEFIEYLIVNGIVAEEWERIKQEDPDKAQHIIDLFSDVVLEGVMRKVKFLEYRDRYELKTFQCLPNKLVLVGISAPAQSDVDFNDAAFLSKAATNPVNGLKVYTTEKAYKTERELELFEMIQAGCLIADGQLFKTLCLALPGA